ncbi:MAG TPA: carboxypeptidase regulatory-like domain-containing protein, partial [Thermoanaerobaculia bacterium]|nr:carboxypeptidase regulatory-like domain-containing protein [Thermoanaerobaculia bacterium]
DIVLQPLARVSGMVIDEAKRPVAAAVIAAEPLGDAFSMRGGPRFSMFRELLPSATGPDGKFSIRIPGDREWKMRATKKGLPVTRSESLKLAAAERKSGVVITLPSGVEVTGTITDADGNALSGASVSAAETQGRGGEMQRMMVMIGRGSSDEEAVQTASDGTFSMRLKEGTYDFTIRREGYSPKTIRAHAVAASGTTPIEAVLDPAVEVSGRVTRGGIGVDGVMILVIGGGASDSSSTTTAPDGSFTLTGLAPGSVSAMLMKSGDFIQEQRTFNAPARDVSIELPAGSRVTGRVVEKGSRRPISSFEAGLSRSRGGPMVMMGPPQLKAFTSDDGSFVLENVPAGSVTLVANAPGFVTSRLNVTVEEGKSLDDVVLELDTGVKLTGRVTGPNGAPLSDVGVAVAPSPTGGFALSGSENRATTDTNGEYTLEALTPGEETITFSHAKHLSKSQRVTLKGREMKLDVQLEGGVRVSGIVVTEAGVPVPDADVRASSAAGMMQSARTNASGQFELDSLAAARYRFTASARGYADGVLEDFDTSSGAPLRIVLKQGGTIYGSVTGLSEQELANAYVMARGAGSGAQTPIDASGSYRLEGAPIGAVQVTAYVRSGMNAKSTAPKSVTVTAGAPMQVDLTFRSDVVIRGRVTRNRQPVSGGSVLFYQRSGGAMSNNATIDDRGNYSISGLEDGEYLVTVLDMQRSGSYSTSYQVRGSGTFDIDFTTASVRGRVVDAANSRPLSGANITLRPASGLELFRGGTNAISDENGVFAVDSVPSGAYTIVAALDTYAAEPRQITVGDTPLDNVELRLSKSDGLTLSLVDARDGRPLGGYAAVYDAQGRMIADTSAPFVFGADPSTSALRVAAAPGSYIATVMAQNYAPQHVRVSAPSTRTIPMTPGGRIEVTSKHSESRLVQLIDANGIAYPRIGPLPRKWALAPRGTTPLNSIAPGTYTLQLLGEDGVSIAAQTTVVVIEGQAVQTEI